MSETAPIYCASCRKDLANKPQHECGVCFDPLCRSCAMFLDEATFSFRSELPDELTQTYYCASCHQTHVEPALEAYNETLARAKEVYFFFDTQKRQPPVLRKAKEFVSVDKGVDRDETILRLGFMAADAGYNAILEAAVEHEKVRDHGWHKTMWRGKGLPATVDEEKLERRTRLNGEEWE